MKSNVYHLLVAVVVALAAFAGYEFWYSAVAAKSAVVAGLQSRVIARAETADRAAAARAISADIAIDEAVVRNYFLPETGVVAFIDSLESQGKVIGVSVQVLSVSATTAGRPAFVVSLTCKGTFDAVMRAVGAIEFAPYDLSLSGFSLMQDAPDTWHADLKLRIGSAATATSSARMP